VTDSGRSPCHNCLLSTQLHVDGVLNADLIELDS
jgi:hypothetical protein